MARPGEPAETYCSLGPGPRLAVGARAVCPPGAQPGQGSSWLMTLRKALPRRPARGASPRTARPAPPRRPQPPADAERNQWVHEAQTTPSALGAAAKAHWLGAPGVWPWARWAGAPRAQQTKTVLLGPARAAQGRASAVGTQRTGAGNLPTARCEGWRSLGVWMALCCSTSSSLPVSWGHGGGHTWNAATLQGLGLYGPGCSWLWKFENSHPPEGAWGI